MSCILRWGLFKALSCFVLFSFFMLDVMKKKRRIFMLKSKMYVTGYSFYKGSFLGKNIMQLLESWIHSSIQSNSRGNLLTSCLSTYMDNFCISNGLNFVKYTVYVHFVITRQLAWEHATQYHIMQHSLLHLSRSMTKPKNDLCAQWRLRSAWAQSDLHLCCLHEETLGP